MTSEPTIEQQAEDLADQTMLRSLNVGPRGMTLDLAPPHELVLSMVETAKKVLGDAPNYTETPVTLTVSAAGEVEHYAFTVQRVGNITPHQAREKAEAELVEARRDAHTARIDYNLARTRADKAEAQLSAVWALVEPWRSADFVSASLRDLVYGLLSIRDRAAIAAESSSPSEEQGERS